MGGGENVGDRIGAWPLNELSFPVLLIGLDDRDQEEL